MASSGLGDAMDAQQDQGAAAGRRGPGAVRVTGRVIVWRMMHCVSRLGAAAWAGPSATPRHAPRRTARTAGRLGRGPARGDPCALAYPDRRPAPSWVTPPRPARCAADPRHCIALERRFDRMPCYTTA